MQEIRRPCWCGNSKLDPYSPEYAACSACGTLVSRVGLKESEITVKNDDEAFYGKDYWLSHQVEDLGYPDIHQRARTDLPERCMHWLQTLLRYKLPAARVLEVGCAHGGFVALMRSVGYDAIGLELSPWVVEFARRTFDVPVLLGPIEDQQLPDESFDAIVLNDVVEHLDNPVATLGACTRLLKKKGIMVVQMPCYPEGTTYEELVARKDRFLELMKTSTEHLNLFSRRAARQLFKQLGFGELEFVRAIFDYDMHLVACRSPLERQDVSRLVPDLTATPTGHITLAWLEMLIQREACEMDRAARLETILRLDADLRASHAARASLQRQLAFTPRRILGRLCRTPTKLWRWLRQEKKVA